MKKMMILAFVAAAMLSVLTFAYAEQPNERDIPSNLPGVTMVPAPPAGFDPLTASDEELQTYELPPRPDESIAPEAYVSWATSMKANAERVFPALELTDHYNGRVVGLSKEADGTSTSNNWSAVVDFTSAKSWNDSTSFYAIIQDYVVPVAIQAYGACTGGWDYSSSWDGIDGSGSGDVLQAGTESDAYCSGSTKSTLYAAWWEWYPNAETRISATVFPVSPGDDLYIEVWDVSATVGYAYLHNYNTNKIVEYKLTAPGTTKLIGNSAEWVVERPGLSTGLATLTNYISDYFSGCVVWTHGNTYYYPGSSGADLVTMESSGKAISYPTLLGTTAIWFRDEGAARGTPVGTP